MFCGIPNYLDMSLSKLNYASMMFKLLEWNTAEDKNSCIESIDSFPFTEFNHRTLLRLAYRVDFYRI